MMRSAALTALLVGGTAAMVWAFLYGGSAVPGRLDRVGAEVLWSLPAAKLVFNLAAACTAGPLVLALFALNPEEPAHRQARRLAGYAASVWAAAAGVFTVANFQLIANMPLFAEGFIPALVSFLTEVDPGRSGLTATGIAAGTAVLCFLARTRAGTALAAAAAFCGLIPLVLNSHAAGGADHADSTMSLFLHSGAAVVWLGGLAGLIWLRATLGPGRLSPVLGRYSTLALLSFIVLAVSGVLAGWAALGSPDQLGTPYGGIVLAKTAVFVVLGSIGALHRQWLIRRIGQGSPRAARQFWVLVLAELGIMGAASGMAASLSRTETPASLGSATTEVSLPAPAPAGLLAQWELDPLWSVACAVGVFLYLAGVRRVHKAGTRWPAHRTVLWVAGIVLLFLITNGGVHVYQGYLFNAHVLTLMLLTAVVPLFLVLASPLTLAEQTITPRTDGSTGGLEMVLSLRRALRMAASTPYSPVVLLAVSLVTIYYTPLHAYAVSSQLGYGIVTVLALLAGCTCTAALTSIPATTGQHHVPVRLTAVAGTMLLYGLYGQAIRAQAAVLEQPWYTTVGQPWRDNPYVAPELAGPIMWFIGATATAVLILIALLHKNPGERLKESLDEHPRPAAMAGPQKTSALH